MISRRILKGAETFQSQAISNWFSYSAAVTPRSARPCPPQVLQNPSVAFSSFGYTECGQIHLTHVAGVSKGRIWPLQVFRTKSLCGPEAMKPKTVLPQ